MSLCPPLIVLGTGRNPSFINLSKLPFSPFSFLSYRCLHTIDVLAAGKQGRRIVQAIAAGQTSESSTSLSVIKSVQTVWENPKDRYGVVGLGLAVAAIMALRTSVNLLNAIDKVPILPSALGFIGIIFSAWFTYRYLLFKPNCAELAQLINRTSQKSLSSKQRYTKT